MPRKIAIFTEGSGSTWAKVIPARKRNLLVYRTTPVDVTPEMAQEYARHLKVSGKLYTDDEHHIITEGKRVLVCYRKTGAFWFADMSKLHNPDYRPNLPSDDDAIELTHKFLAGHDWLPKNAVIAGIIRQGSEQIEGRDRKRRLKRENSVCVSFRLTFNGLNTYGPGAKIKVHIGHEGEVIGLFHSAQSVAEYAKFPALSQRQLEYNLAMKLRVPLEKLEVKNVQLAYHAESCVTDTNFMQPTYIFQLTGRPKSRRTRKTEPVTYEMHPLPATMFAPMVGIKGSGLVEIKQGEPLKLGCEVRGGTPPFKFTWDSKTDGHLSNERELYFEKLGIAHRNGRITAHTIRVTVTDSYGLQDSHSVLVRVLPKDGTNPPQKPSSGLNSPNDPYVGVEWCNNYNGTPGLPDIAGTDASAEGFRSFISGLSGWSSRFNWGDLNAWEEDFKMASAPGGGNDSNYADNVHFAFFAGHGSSGSFWFGSTVDDHEMAAQDARWGDGILNWIVLHACNTMMANFAWDVWCDAFKGLHMMFGFHTTTEGSTPPLGKRFAFWMSFRLFSPVAWFNMREAWKIACTECFDSDVQWSIIYANQAGTNTNDDHLPGFGYVSSDPISPNIWVYYRGTC